MVSGRLGAYGMVTIERHDEFTPYDVDESEGRIDICRFQPQYQMLNYALFSALWSFKSNCDYVISLAHLGNSALGR
jgi:hypothetical protein